MNVSHKLFKKCGLVAALACPLAAALLWNPPGGLNATAQTPPPAASPGIVAGGLVGTNAPSGTNAPAATNAPSGTNSPVATNAPAGTNAPTGTNTVAGTNAPSGTNDGITVSFQGANVDMIAQWLAQTTGKNVVKHPRVQCQVTIMGGRKMPMRDALNLVYRALAVEGNTVTETSKSIIITPEGSEPKMSPELLSAGEVPEGKQRLVKVFALQHVQAADLKDKLKGLVSEKALIDIDEKGNRIMVTDYNDNIGLIKDLVTMLDTESPADVTLRMLPLKHVSAQNLAKEIQPLYQRMRERNPKEVVEISANDRSNSLLIMSSEPNFRSIERLVASLDTEEAQEKVMRAYMLKNADAQDVAKQLKDLYNTSDDGGGVTYYRYIYADQSSGNSKKSSFVADRRRNAVIVQAPLSAIDPIEEMIKALDEPVNDDNLAPKIYQLKYVSAGDIEDILNELFLKKTQRSYYYSDDYYMSASTDRDVGRLYGKVRITSEPYANVIIITANSAENLGAVEDVVKQLDVPSQAGDTTMRVQLKFAKATDVSSSLNILFAKNGSPAFGQGSQNQQRNAGQQQNQNQGQGQNTSSQGVDFQLEPNAKEEGYFPWLGGQPDSSSGFGGSDSKSGSRPVSDLVGRVRVVPDQRINAILISANIHLFPEVVKLVEQMDEPTAQVLIEAKILEVSSDLLNSLGVRWSPDGSKSFSTDDYDMSLMPKLTGEYKQFFGPAVSALADSQHTGVIDSTLSLDFLVQFLKRTTGASVMAEPQINISDNEMGRLFVGSQVPFVNNSQNTDTGSLNKSYSYKNVGVILEVTPHINNNGDVALRIRAESSTVGVTYTDGVAIDTRNFRTDMTAKNGQTVVLGGINQKQRSEVVRKVPILGDIPVLGYLFKKKDSTSKEVELMVFLRPRVIRTVKQARELYEDVQKNSPLIRQWQQDNEPTDAPKSANENKKSKK